jgi:hypothetical protein
MIAWVFYIHLLLQLLLSPLLLLFWHTPTVNENSIYNVLDTTLCDNVCQSQISKLLRNIINVKLYTRIISVFWELFSWLIFMEDFLKKIAHRVYGKSKSVTDKHYHIRLYQVHYIYYFHSLWVCVKIATIEVIIIIVKEKKLPEDTDDPGI